MNANEFCKFHECYLKIKTMRIRKFYLVHYFRFDLFCFDTVLVFSKFKVHKCKELIKLIY